MKFIDQRVYIECRTLKGRPRKPIAVCRQCRRKRKCTAYQNYLQPCLPFQFPKADRVVTV